MVEITLCNPTMDELGNLLYRLSRTDERYELTLANLNFCHHTIYVPKNVRLAIYQSTLEFVVISGYNNLYVESTYCISVEFFGFKDIKFYSSTVYGLEIKKCLSLVLDASTVTGLSYSLINKIRLHNSNLQTDQNLAYMDLKINNSFIKTKNIIQFDALNIPNSFYNTLTKKGKIDDSKFVFKDFDENAMAIISDSNKFKIFSFIQQYIEPKNSED